MCSTCRECPLLQVKALLILGLAVLGASSAALAQSRDSTGVELIVRPVNGAPSSFVRRLRTPTAKGASDSLFAEVVASHPVFAEEGGEGAGGGPKESRSSPIPAFTLTLRDSSALNRLQERLRRRAEVQYVHPNVEYEVTRAPAPSSDPVLDPQNVFADSLDHLSVVRALEGWEVTAGEQSVSVGIVDTGIFFEHPDLADQVRANAAEDLDGDGQLSEGDRNGTDDDGNGFVDDVVGYDFVDRPHVIEPGEFEDRDPDPSPDSTGRFSGHGTAVAGIVSAQAAEAEAGMVGVAPKTRLVALRAFGGDGIGQTDDIAAAIVYGASQGVDVLNLSFGRSRSAPLLEEAIEYAASQGTVVVASAGNEGAVDDPHYPSDYPEVISVVWLAEDGEDVPDFSRSQHGIGADLGAPGSNVFTTQYPRRRLLNDQPLRREDLYGNSSGSSFSAPQVAGAAALLRSVDSTLTPIAVRSILTGTAGDINGVSWSHTTGAGRLDVARGLLRSVPAQTELHFPEHNDGLQGNQPVPVVGTALDPNFQDYALYYAEGTRNLDVRPNPWRSITEPVQRRAHRDTLGTWDVTALDEGAYTLRLVTTLEDGRTVEDRRRVVIDRTPPEADIQFLGAGRIEGHWGILADVAVDDTVQSRMRVHIRGQTHVTEGEFETARQGLTWVDERGLGGTASVQVTLTNRSGLRTRLERTVSVPSDETNSSFFRPAETTVPAGHLLSRPTDFDEDALPEIVLNQFQDRGLSDTLRTFEWTPSAFAPADTLLARLLPKDVGDTDRDGRKELLLQIRGVTVLLEQRSRGGIPDRLIYADTTAVSPSLSGPSLHGARLTDLDRDGRGEIVGNWKTDSSRTKWRVLEREGDTFRQVEEVENPTEQLRPDTLRSSPEAATGDFDGDGRRDLLIGDRDGNWVVYESTGNDGLRVAWTYETDRFDTDDRFAVGDVVGDDRPEFITYSTYDLFSQEGGEREPPISFYHVWTAVGDDEYERSFRLPVAGERSGGGSIATADFNGDGRDEVAIAHPPSLFVLGRTSSGEVSVLHESRARPSILSPSIVAGDFDGDGVPSLIAATTDDQLRRYTVNRSALQHSPPRWVRAVPAGSTSTRLVWRAPRADSVVVYAGSPGGELDPVAAQRDSATTIDGGATRRFALRAWFDGTSSPFSAERVVRPHPPATVTKVRYPEPSTVRLRFTEPLDPSVRADQFELDSNGSAASVVLANNGTGVVVRFSSSVAGQQDRLLWTGVTDASGLPVAQTAVPVSFPPASNRSLFVEDFRILAEQRVRLTFNEALNGEMARDEERYRVRPHGVVEEVRAEGSAPTSVTLQLDGVVAGATGQEAALTVTSMRSTRGNRLVEEGATVRLTEPAHDLSNVYVYPNPIELTRHDKQLTVAGLPKTAEVRIYSPGGRLVEVLSVEESRTGGTTWDLRDRRGELVPSGIYLVRVEAPEARPVLKKAAVVR